MEKLESIKSKIEKLFNKAESAKELGSLAEAEMFMAKAQDILMKYNIDKGDLNLGFEQGNPCIVDKYLNMKDLHGWSKTDGRWLLQLYSYVGRFNFCKVVSHGTNLITIIGEPVNVDTIKYMVANIVPKIKQLRGKAWREYHGPEKTNSFKRGYYAGAASGIFAKLRDQQEANKVKFSGLEGIIKLHNVMVDEKTAETFNSLRSAKGRQLSSVSGFNRGHSDSKGISLNKGVSGSNSSGPLKLG